MFRLIERTAEEGIAHHRHLPTRIYTGTDDTHGYRIRETIEMVRRALGSRVAGGDWPNVIVEPGCGTADICGPFSEEGWPVWGIECKKESADLAAERFPKALIKNVPIGPHNCVPNCATNNLFALCILCEFLEHVETPVEVAKHYLFSSDLSVISHPIDEQMGSCWSGDDHLWSFTLADHLAFFAAGKHAIDETKILTVGPFQIALSRGHHQ